MVGEGFQFLHDGGEVKLVACTGKAPQPHTIEPVMRLQVRKRISTFLRSLRDLVNSGVPIKARVASRASSCTSRGIFRKLTLGVHLGLSGHELRSRALAR
jgi:hypothetical protein